MIDESRDILAIMALKSRYFRCLDLKLWDELGNVFTRDALFDARAALGGLPDDAPRASLIGQGRAAIVDFIRKGSESLITVHHGTNHEIYLDGPDIAHGVIALADRVWSREGQPIIAQGFGHYEESYQRDEGQWRIHHSKLTRILVDYRPPN